VLQTFQSKCGIKKLSAVLTFLGCLRYRLSTIWTISRFNYRRELCVFLRCRNFRSDNVIERRIGQGKSNIGTTTRTLAISAGPIVAAADGLAATPALNPNSQN
jgi:hypothetical protein